MTTIVSSTHPAPSIPGVVLTCTDEGFVIKDSGKREHFETGAQRDTQEGKGRYDLLSHHAARRKALVYEKGAVKYEARNWEKGMQISRMFSSTLRHLFQYMAGDRTEDHLGQAGFGVDGMIHIEEEVLAGKLPAELHDLPWSANFLIQKAVQPQIGQQVLLDEDPPPDAHTKNLDPHISLAAHRRHAQACQHARGEVRPLTAPEIAVQPQQTTEQEKLLVELGVETARKQQHSGVTASDVEHVISRTVKALEGGGSIYDPHR